MRAALLAAAAGLALGLPHPAPGGDTAEAEVLGFSADGRLFAFEEWGVQDGSGWPYASIFVVDTDTDAWMPGTPIRVRLQDESATVAEARAEAAARLRAAMGERFRPADAVTLAHSPLGEVESDPLRLAFAPVLPALPLGTPELRYEARLELYHAETETPDCVTAIGDRPMGFRLTVEREGGGSAVLHDDEVVPRSRGCPITYRISRVVVPGHPAERVAVLLSVFTPGFEGPQRRFIAVTGRLPE
jgi:predicted secreted protein